MRILNVTQSYYPFQSRGGPAFKVRSISRALANRGHSVTVLTADLGFKDRNEPFISAVRTPTGWHSMQQQVESIYLHSRGRYRALTVNPGVFEFCRRRLRDFDLVHIYGLYDLLGPIVAHYCRDLGTPYFVEPLGMTIPIDRGFMLKKLWHKVVGNYLGGASKLIATSELERNELLAFGFSAESINLRHNGIDSEGFGSLPPVGSFRKRIGLGPENRLVLFLGRLIPRKGADLLIEALPKIALSDVSIAIAGPEGEHGYLNFLRNKARQSGVEDRVYFPGALYGDDKTAALVDADVFVLPSRYENFGNTAAEAIACGTPVVVTDRCGVAPLINQRAGLTTQYEANAIANSLAELLNNAPLYARLQVGCAEVAAELSWNNLVLEVETLYARSLLAGCCQSAAGETWSEAGSTRRSA